MNRYILKGTVNEISSEPAFIYKNYLRISCFRSNGIGPFKLKKTTLFIGLRYQRYRQESGMPFLLKWRVTKKYIDSPFQSRYPEFISLSFLHNISHLTKIFKFQSTLLSSSPSSLPQDLKMTFMRLTYPIHSPPYPTTTFCFILTYPIHSPPYPTTFCFISLKCFFSSQLQQYHFPPSIFFFFVEIHPFPAKLFRKNHTMTQIEGPSNVSVVQTKDKELLCVQSILEQLEFLNL